MSDDDTRKLITAYTQKYPYIYLLSNEKKVTPVAMNMGIRAAKGDYIIILSSHSQIDPQFLRLNMKGFATYPADCVGGVIITLPANESLIAKSIAFALAHPFGVGNSHFRIGTSEAKYVDTVPFGCYKRDVLDRIGLFDEDLVRNQDDEINLRLLKSGGKILLLPEIKSFYHARDSLKKLWKMYYQYGHFKPLVASKVGGVLTWRQLIPSLFVVTLIMVGILSLVSHNFLYLWGSIIFLYLLGNLYFTLSVAMRNGLKYFMVLPAVFTILHFSYGIGYLKGIWDFILMKKQNKNKIEDLPLTR